MESSFRCFRDTKPGLHAPASGQKATQCSMSSGSLSPVSGLRSLFSFAQTLVLNARNAFILCLWLTQLAIADVALSALLPISAVLPTVSYDIASLIAASVWRGIQAIFTGANEAKIVVTGDVLPANESAIVVSNHIEWTDFYMIQELAIRAGMLSRCRWFAKQQLKWVPFLGWGLWAMGMPLVSRNWMQDKKEMYRVFRGATEKKWPVWLIAFSEATRFTKSKREEAIKWAKANGKIMPKHLLYPRTKGFVACAKHLRQAPHVKAVYDITIAYATDDHFQKPPAFWHTMFQPHLNRRHQFLVHAKRYSLRELPESDQELAHWLEDRWLEKGVLLEDLREMLSRGQAWETLENTL